MKPLLLLAAGAAALTLAACERHAKTPGPAPTPKAVSRLDCPEKEGDLVRTAQAADGASCAYAGKDGAEVTLRLIALTGEPEAALAPLEAELKALIPAPNAAEKVMASKDKAQVTAPGLSIKAGDEGADIQVGGLHIDADNAGAEIRHSRDSDGGVRATYILASDKSASGWGVVGYEARGPKAGPLVVGVVKARGRHGRSDDVFDDMKDLIERNTGG